MSKKLYFKYIQHDGRPAMGSRHFSYLPFLPRDGKPGLWTPPIPGPLEPCLHAYHAASLSDFPDWLHTTFFRSFELPNRRFYLVEGGDEVIHHVCQFYGRAEMKHAFRTIRLVRRLPSLTEDDLREINYMLREAASFDPLYQRGDVYSLILDIFGVEAEEVVL